MKHKPPWRVRKGIYIQYLREAGPDVLLVSACDQLHNARSIVSNQRTIGNVIFSRFNVGKEQSLWYYGTLAEVFQFRLPGPLSDELNRTVRDMQNGWQLNQVNCLYSQTYDHTAHKSACCEHGAGSRLYHRNDKDGGRDGKCGTTEGFIEIPH